jgi:hypothetical protein
MSQNDSDSENDGVTLSDEQHDWTAKFVGFDARSTTADDAAPSTTTSTASEGSEAAPPTSEDPPPAAVPSGDPDGGTSQAQTDVSASQSDPAANPSDPLPDPVVQPTGTGGIPFFINPDNFDFKPTGPNWQTTSCVEIVFGYGSPFLPMTRISVGVVVGAPLTLRDGKQLSVREAQLDSANAAEAAALIIKGMLDAGEIGLSEVQPRFVGFMGGAIMSTGLGYRVTGCRPK